MAKSKRKRKRAPSRLVNLIFLLLAIACFVYYILNGLIVRFGQSLLWVWPIIGGALLIRWALVRRMIRKRKPSPIPRVILKLLHALIAIGLAFFIFVEGVILTGAFESAPGNLDYIVVLGAKVNGKQPSGALRNRIEVAADYLMRNPGTLAIASGGQGNDEEISEAECIRAELVERGVDAARILMEDKSTSTAENLAYSLKLVIGGNDTRIGVVTNNFHAYRAKRIAENAGDYEFYALPVPTSLLSFPHYMLREFATVVVDTLRGNLG